MKPSKYSLLIALMLITLLSGCVQPAPSSRPWMLDATASVPMALAAPVTEVDLPTQRPVESVYYTPTPDSPHNVPAQSGGISSEFKILPDSELVYSPVSSMFDVAAFVREKGGYLSTYSEYVDDLGIEMSGSDIVKQLALDYSVNPRLLLAILEYQSGWVTRSDISENSKLYPLGLYDINYPGLYIQLSWAADQMNFGYYAWKANALGSSTLTDGNPVSFSTTLNAGTVAVQYMLAMINGTDGWSQAVSANGVYAAYVSLFGIPFDYSYEDLIPSGLSQPTMQLPFERGDTWSFTGGPHSSWGNNAAWGALDFAPPSEIFGCFSTDIWVVAVADGVIVRSGNGAVVLDLDGDGREQTGWTVLYMHIESGDRIAVGAHVKAGDRIGHPSCEGGYSTATHLHLARRYNGEWIAADGQLPFVLDGWVSQGNSYEYNGCLVKDGVAIVAEDGIIDENQIKR